MLLFSQGTRKYVVGEGIDVVPVVCSAQFINEKCTLTWNIQTVVISFSLCACQRNKGIIIVTVNVFMRMKQGHDTGLNIHKNMSVTALLVTSQSFLSLLHFFTPFGVELNSTSIHSLVDLSV